MSLFSLPCYVATLPLARDVTCILVYAVPPPVEGWRSFFSEAPRLMLASEAAGEVQGHRLKYAGIGMYLVSISSFLLLQWWARRRDTSSLAVALMSLSAALWIGGYGAVVEHLEWPSFLLRRRLEFAAVSGMGATGLLTAMVLFHSTRRPLNRALVAAAAVATAATLLVPTRLLAWSLFALAQPAAGLCALSITATAGRALFDSYSNRERRVLAAGMAIPAVFGVVDLALSRMGDVRLGLMTYALAILPVVLASTLARRNATALNATEIFAASSARFVPQEFLHALGHQDLTTVRLGDARERPMTVLFADLRNFTAISENLSPAETFAFLNECFAQLGPPIRDHGGFIDKYIGDAIMALFPDDPAQAVRAALAMQKAIACVPSPRGGDRQVRMGVGVHLGRVIMGTIGEEMRLEATVISDAVNLAARLEGFTKQVGCSLLISGAVAQELPDDLLPHLRDLGRFAVKGKAEPVTMFEIFALDGRDMRRHKIDTRVRFRQGIEAFFSADYEEASTLFGDIVDRCPEDGPAHWWFLRALRELTEDAPKLKDPLIVKRS